MSLFEKNKTCLMTFWQLLTQRLFYFIKQNNTGEN
jgi:hypothetical protein